MQPAPAPADQLDTDAAATSDGPATATAELADELLIEEISIDGMCGVY